jgi:hypothetical protein
VKDVQRCVAVHASKGRDVVVLRTVEGGEHDCMRALWGACPMGGQEAGALLVADKSAVIGSPAAGWERVNRHGEAIN